MRELRRDTDRFLTVGDGVRTRHSFSYGVHYDPTQIGFGPVTAVNTETVEPGGGYDAHRHADVEIVTWVLEGALRHEDTTGQRGVVRPGTAQRLSAGTGVEHAEQNASATEPLVFVQMMLVSDHDGPPSYAQADVDPVPDVLAPTVDVHAPARLHVVRLETRVEVPAAPRSLLLVTAGSVRLDDTVLTAGDEARLTDAGAYDLSAVDDGADILIWQLQR